MTYDLTSTLDRERFATRVSYLLDKGAAVELTEKVQRSLSQNNYLHAIIGAVAMETGNTLADAKHHYFKCLVNPDIFVRTKVDSLGNKVETVRSTSELSHEEMSLALDRLHRWASGQGIYLPRPEDTDLLRQVEIELGRMKQYLV
jgi:DNA topoisomerase IB